MLQGSFIADFTSFYDACQKAEVSLKSFETGSSKVETALNRMVDNFSGRKLVQEATLMAEAVDRIGGTSKLTEDELARVGAKAAEATDKMRAMGIDIPPGLQKIADETKVVTLSTEELVSGAEKIAGAFGLAFGATEIISFSKELLETTSKLEDLSRATGISTEGLQRMAYVGTGFGVDLETFSRGVEQFSTKLATGNQQAVLAVEKLGLSVKDLLAAGPEEAFLRFASAAGSIEDPMQKDAVAAEAFGQRLGRTLVPAFGDLAAKMKAVPKESIITDEAIKKAHEFDTALQQSVITFKAWLVDFATAKTVYSDENYEQEKVTETTERTTQALQDQGNAVPKVISNTDLLTNALKAWRTEGLEPLNKTQQAAIDLGVSLGKSQTEIAAVLGVSEGAIHAYVETSKVASAEAKKFSAAQAEVESAGSTWRDTVASMDQGVADYSKTLLAAGVSQQAVATYMGLSATQAKDLAKSLEVQNAALVTSTKLWDQYYTLIVQHGGTADEQATAQINAWAENTRAALRKAGTDTKENMALIDAVVQETTRNIGVSWSQVTSSTRRGLQEQAADALKTYQAMAAAGDVPRAALQKQYDLYRQLSDRARGYGDAAVDAHTKAAKAVDEQTRSMHALSEADAAINGDLDSQIKNVRTLSGEWLTAAEAKKAFDQGNSVDVNKANFYSDQVGVGPRGDGNTANTIDGIAKSALEPLLELGFSLQEAEDIIRNGLDPSQWQGDKGPRVPGFGGGVENFGGGLAVVGEKGPELVNLPRGSSVFANGTGPGGGSASVTINMNVSGQLDDRVVDVLADRVNKATVRAMEQRGWRAPLSVRR